MKTITTTQNDYALQCCLLCRHTLTDREQQHDKLEQSILEAIRAEHPEWRDGEDSERTPHVARYRSLL
ncbi:MAG: hypothetical protein H0V88_10065, partial [Pyrinomonadaceae bacterium]|nr:hypothetical protein [Pyrinomonadaceae bacterium]